MISSVPSAYKLYANKMQSECKVDANSKPWLDSGKTVLLQRVSSLEVKPNLKVKLMKRVMLVMAVALMSALQVSAQNVKIDDKELVGVWLMESINGLFWSCLMRPVIFIPGPENIII